MGVNRGKQFEGKFREAVEKYPNISIDRFPDPMMGFKGIRNICDFGIYKYPFQYYFECKSITGNTLNFKSDITEDQWSGLTDKVKITGVAAGILVWFIEHDTTVFAPIQELERLKQSGAKSLNIKNITNDELQYFYLDGRKKRVFFEYDVAPMFTKINRWLEENHGPNK